MEKKLKYFLVVLTYLSFSVANSQVFELRHKIYGQFFELKSQKPLRRVPVTVLPYNKEIYTDNHGAFILNMPEGEFSLIIDYLPFEKTVIDISLKSDTTIKIYLKTNSEHIYIDEVDVSAKISAAELPENIRNINRNLLLQIPAIGGEKDIIKSLGVMAGVTSSSEGAADLQVRGGFPGQNLFLLDDTPIYSTSHFFGMISTYNPLIVQNAKLYKSGFPVEYGGRLSSVVNIKTRDPSLIKSSFESDFSLLSTKLRLNVPIVKNKIGLTLSGRLSNYAFINLLSFYNKSEDEKLNMFFSDINASVLWQISDNDKFKISWFKNNDDITVVSYDITSENRIWLRNKQNNLSASWNKYAGILNNQLLVYYDNSGFDFGMTFTGRKTNFNITDQVLSGIKTYGIKDKLDIDLSERVKLAAGINLNQTFFSPVQFHYSDSLVVKNGVFSDMVVYEGIMFGSVELNLNTSRKIQLGLRTGAIYDQRHSFPLVEPRISYHEVLTSGFSLNASVDKMSQSVHRMANPGLGYPFEIYLPSADGIKPSESLIYSVGCAKDINLNKIEATLKTALWFKQMKNIVEFKDGYDVLTSVINKFGMDSELTSLITQGEGRAYGIDVSGELKYQKLSFLSDYTLMRSINQFDDLNNGIAYDAANDIRHSVALTTTYRLSDRWNLSANWQYMSGKPITIPETIFNIPSYDVETGTLYDDQLSYKMVALKRNNYRTKPFHKMDIELSYQYKFLRKFDSNIAFGLYNAYNQRNPFIYLLGVDNEKDGPEKQVVKSMSLFPIMPTFNWSIKF